ncbi:MAG: GNAT family N-acetyltransferase [Pleurocapsa sp. SU_5_0]|nr:GNAT family N-acetyltransferase [Pleurocapsa sp. SU_5_0]NJO94839.1 GNAT family N-acetyltransferase [Pleurocapsa sp. CRU_1_2]
MQILETSRLTLRYITSRDAEALMAILGDAEVMQFSIIGIHSSKQIKQFIEQRLISYLEYGFGLYALVHKQNQELIGYCGFFIQSIEQQKEVEVGYRLAKKYWGQGLATEAAKAVVEYGQQRFNFRRFVCLIEIKNNRSIRVAQKLGMKLEKKIIYHGLNVAMYSLDC